MQTRTFREIWEPLVHANFRGNSYGPIPLLPCFQGGIKRDKLNGTNGFLRKSAVSCGFLRKSAVSCGFLRKSAPPKCCNSQEKRKSAKINENLRKSASSARFIPFSLSLLIPLDCFQYGPMALKVCQTFPPRLVLVHCMHVTLRNCWRSARILKKSNVA